LTNAGIIVATKKLADADRIFEDWFLLLLDAEIMRWIHPLFGKLAKQSE
jgi:hypothetical protein